MRDRTFIAVTLGALAIYLTSLFFAYASGLNKNEHIAIRATDNLEFAFNELVRCVATTERNLAYVAEVDAELHAEMLLLPPLPLVEVDR